MSWVVACLASAWLFAGVGVLDKHIIAAHIPGLRPFYVLVGVIQLAMAGIAALAAPWEGGASAGVMVAAVGSGVLWGISLVLLFYALEVLEVSRVVPIFHTFPVFVAFGSMLFLDERLLWVQWLAILVIVAGAGLVTLGQGRASALRKRKATLAFGVAFLSSIVTAAATVTTKFALEELSFWNVFTLRALLMGGILVVPALRPGGFREMSAVLANRNAVILIMLAEGVLAPAAVYTMFLGLALGSASLASALISTRPVFVLFLSVLLSTRFWKLLDEPLTTHSLALKSLSTAMVVGGVGLLTLA